MVARTPPLAREKRAVAAALNPALVRETVKKVDRCVARLQELQYTVSGGRKVVDGVSLSPRSTRGYLRTSLRCKQETLRMKNTTAQKSPPGKFPAITAGEWRQMSLPAMLLGETVVEILQATQFAKQAVVAANTIPSPDPKTPTTTRRTRAKQPQDDTPELRLRRTREKQHLLRTIRTESRCGSPSLPRARTRITFKGNSPQIRREAPYRHMVAAHKVSPKNRPWVKKTTTLLFPNPTFNSTHDTNSSQQQKAKSPETTRRRRSPPHKFIVKSPVASKIQVRIKSPPPPAVALSTPVKQRRSFSPAKLANRLVSPLKSRISAAYGSRRRSTGGVLATAANSFGMSTPVGSPTPRTNTRK